MIDISIIVPAYNAEKYISACLDSLVNQTKKEIEIIAVNDGSTDNTLNILKEYKEKFPKKIKIISQSNQGLSVARNNGIKASSGKYIALIDSDDEVDLELFDKLWNKVNEYPYEIVAFDVELIYPQKTLTVKSGFKTDNKNISTKDSASFFIDMYCMACNKIIKETYSMMKKCFLSQILGLRMYCLCIS